MNLQLVRSIFYFYVWKIWETLRKFLTIYNGSNWALCDLSWFSAFLCSNFKYFSALVTIFLSSNYIDSTELVSPFNSCAMLSFGGSTFFQGTSRTYKRKTVPVSPEAIQRAMLDVSTKRISLSRAAKMHNVSQSTLGRRRENAEHVSQKESFFTFFRKQSLSEADCVFPNEDRTL